MAPPTETRQWILAEKPSDLPKLDGPNPTFKLVTNKLPALQDGQILVKPLFISNDPAQRGWMDANQAADRLYTAPIEKNDPIRAYTISEVVDTKAPDSHPVGTVVRAGGSWSEYFVANAKECAPVQPLGDLSLAHYTGTFGGPGMTAYYGLIDVVRTTAEDVVVVSGAAGATGSTVVQIAKKLLGCKRVVGIAGSDDKCRWVESLGADVCVNYKSASFKDDLKKATEGFVDVYFDNVGGDILDFMLTRMKRNGRIAACGAVSNYNLSDKSGIKNWMEIITMRIEIRGFIVLDAGVKLGEIGKKLVEAYKEGKLVVTDQGLTEVPTKFEDIPKTWMMLFEGGNTGKLATKVIQ